MRNTFDGRRATMEAGRSEDDIARPVLSRLFTRVSWALSGLAALVMFAALPLYFFTSGPWGSTAFIYVVPVFAIASVGAAVIALARREGPRVLIAVAVAMLTMLPGAFLVAVGLLYASAMSGFN